MAQAGQATGPSRTTDAARASAEQCIEFEGEMRLEVVGDEAWDQQS
jgi:hypothetical protein